MFVEVYKIDIQDGQDMFVGGQVTVTNSMGIVNLSRQWMINDQTEGI